MIDSDVQLYIWLIIVFTGFVGLTIIVQIIDRFLPYRFFCDKMSWHHTPKDIGFDGASFKGICPRCGKHILQDSQGGWS